ncbi:heme-binding domain-containing protein [Nonlabens antarcticus]|uniref:heme-binding domain-containing protein n=1 Tax=Nonlabens antarcticus TaxID=392714 RepID=UPI0018917418|nr:heme-binding domain-containing protein [Nonlabens antarcticus]
MKIFKIIAWVALGSFIVIQFFPVDYNSSETVPKTDFMLVNKVPATIEKTLQVSCYDCHSNNTEYPWYNKVQPVAWYLEDHVKQGKSELNFNEWDSYSDRRKNSKLRSMIKQIESGEMPMESYTLIHRDAIMDSLKQNTVINFLKELKSKN